MEDLSQNARGEYQCLRGSLARFVSSETHRAANLKKSAAHFNYGGGDGIGSID